MEETVSQNSNVPSVRLHFAALLSEPVYGRQEDALGHYQAALDMSPNSIEYMLPLAFALSRDQFKRYNEAEALVIKALAIAPESADANAALGMLYQKPHFEQAKRDQSASFVKKALQIDPNHKLALKSLQRIDNPDRSPDPSTPATPNPVKPPISSGTPSTDGSSEGGCTLM
eukprot:402394_1